MLPTDIFSPRKYTMELKATWQEKNLFSQIKYYITPSPNKTAASQNRKSTFECRIYLYATKVTMNCPRIYKWLIYNKKNKKNVSTKRIRTANDMKFYRYKTII